MVYSRRHSEMEDPFAGRTGIVNRYCGIPVEAAVADKKAFNFGHVFHPLTANRIPVGAAHKGFRVSPGYEWY